MYPPQSYSDNVKVWFSWVTKSFKYDESGIVFYPPSLINQVKQMPQNPKSQAVDLYN